MLSRPIGLVLFLFVGREAYTDRFLLVPQVCAAPGGCGGGGGGQQKEAQRMQKAEVDCLDVRDGASIQPVRLAQFRFNTNKASLRVQVTTPPLMA